MGCAGSKNEVRQSEHLGVKNVEISEEQSNEKKILKEDEEVQVLQEGKSINKSVLDEITDKKLTLKDNEKTTQSTTSNKELKEQPVNELNKEDRKNIHVLPDPVQEKSSSPKNLNENKPNKLAFENHPHEFDFSFIEEKKESKEKEEIEDELLKEMRGIN